MPSPFPGMDPYLESPYIWPDFHQALAGELRRWLNQNLPKPYYARMEMRPEIGVVEDDGGYVRRIIPDISVVRRPRDETAVAVADPVGTAISESLEVTVSSEMIDHAMVEVRDPTHGHQLVTLIEIVSPANKNSGQDRNNYFKKQAEVLASDANLIEIDLLRGGKRLFSAPELDAIVAQLPKHADYAVMLNRVSKRKGGLMAYQIFPIQVTNPLPCVPLPLRNGQPDIPLNLQYFFQLTYNEGPYARGAVDYSKPPHPPLSAELAVWAQQCLRQAGLISSAS